MTSSNQRYLLFIEPNRMYFYGMQMEQPFPIDVPSAAVRDLEVLNRDQLNTIIDTFLTSGGISGGTLIMVLSNALLFEKQIVQDLSDEKRRAGAIKEFIDNVPFEQVAYLSYPVQTGVGVLATNEELFISIKKAFERKNVQVHLIVPVRAFGDIQVAQTGLDAQTAVFFMQNADQVKQFAFHATIPAVVEAQYTGGSTPPPSSSKKKTGKPGKTKLPIYLSIFGSLMFILVVMLVITNQPAANKPTTTTANANEPAAQAEPPAAPATAPAAESEASVSAGLDLASVRIQIQAPPAQRAKVDSIVSQLTDAGYTTVDVAEAPAAPTTVLLLDKSKLTTAQRAAVADEMKSYVAEFTVQEVDQAAYAVQLIVGPSL